MTASCNYDNCGIAFEGDGAVFYFIKKKQRKEDKRMKKKVLAFLLASAMVIESFSVASAADFSDGMGQDTVQFSDDAEDVPEVESDDVDQFGTDAVGEDEDFVPQAKLDNEETNITWNVLDADKDGFDDTLVISGTGDMTEYEGENYVPWHVYASGITQVIVEDGITSIGRYAFSNFKKLKNLNLGNDIKKIGSSAFVNCVSLQELNIPEQVTEIGWYAFQGCSLLKKVNLSDSVTEIGNSAFKDCALLNEVNMSDNLSTIGDEAFYNCKELRHIFFPKTLTKVGKKAFIKWIGGDALLVLSDIHYPGLKSDWDKIDGVNYKVKREATLTEKVHFSVYHNSKAATCTSPGYGGYWSCNSCGGKGFSDKECRNNIDTLLIIEPALGHQWDDGKIVTKDGKTVLEHTCKRCQSVKYEDIKENIEITRQGMKWLDHNSVELKFQSNIKGTYYIEKVKRGENAPKIDITQAGTLIEANTTVTAKVADLPEDEVDIYVCIVSESDESNYGTVMFQPISSERPRLIASTIKFGDNITAYIEDDTIIFSGNGTIYDTDDMDIGDAEDIWWGNGIDKRKIKHVIFKEDGGAITRIGNYLLGSFENLKDVKLPNGLLEIGEGAFFDCNNLMNIDLPEKVRLVERSAFSNTGISAMNWPKNATSIPDGAFVYTNLKEFTVPEGVTEINLQAFYGCTDLIKISIPRSVTYIGSDVFANCRNLTIYGFRDSAAEAYAKANTIKFVSADYKVIFKENGRTKKTEYVTEGQNATPPTLDAKAGYTLSWDTDYTNITEDMVINAVWTKKDSGSSGGGTTIIVTPSESTKYTVTFKDRGEVVKTEKVKSGDAAEYPFITRSGYKLSWDKDFSKITANITVNAVWTVIKPAKVTSLVAEADKKSIALSWDETEYTSYYLVYRKADGETEYTQVAKTTKVLWTDSKAVPGTQYSYKVVAVRSLEGKKYQGADSDVVTTKIGTPQIGDTYSVGDLNYKLTGTKEVTVTGLAKVTDTLVIPSSVTISGKVYKVTAIQDKAFYRNEDIVNVTIGNNVVNVGKYAFYQCSGLETVKFGKRVAIINTCAFTQCPNLENVTLPSSIRKIGAKAFYQCTSIKIFKINGSALEYVGKKGLAINKTVTLRLPKKSYSSYRKLIKASSVYVKTKFVKF